MKILNSTINFIRKHYRIILTIMFSLIAIILYGSLSFHDNIWYDEAYQMILNENNLIDIVKYVARDFHVPIYAIGLKIITTIFGNNLFVARMFSLTAIIASFILSFTKIKDLFSLKTSILFSCFLLSLSCFYFSSIEIRPYSWPMFLTLTSSVYMISLIKNQDNKSFIMYIIFSTLSMYSHNIAMIYIFCSNLVFLIYLIINNRKLLRKYFLSFLTILLLYLPWIKTLKEQYKSLNNKFWIEKPELFKFLESCKELISNKEYIIYILLILLIISVIYTILKKYNKKINYLLLGNFLISIVFIYLISKYKTPILISKYLVTFIGIFILVVSDFLVSINKKNWYLLILVILVLNSYDNYKYEKPKIIENNINSLKEYINKEEHVYFIHYTEFGLGEFRYLFPNAIHLYTDEIDSNLRDYELFGDNVIKLDNIKDLENMDIKNLYTVNLDFSIYANDSLKYFKSWEIQEYYEYLNNYYFGRHYLKKLERN